MPYTPLNDSLPTNPNVIAGTPASPYVGPLLSAEDYQWITKDNDSNPADIEQAIIDTEELTAIECTRSWRYGQYTENLFLYKNGQVFPSACPIDLNQPIKAGSEVFNPAGVGPGQPTSTIQGAGIWVGWFTPLPWMPVWTGVIPPQTIVTYWGGIMAETMPMAMKRLFARVAWHVLHPVVLTGRPLGAKSVGIGGLSVGGDLSSMTLVDPQLKRDLKRFRRPMVRGWQS